MRVLLIGGSGFIGPHVARALQRDGHQVAVFHRGRTPAPSGASEILGDRQRLRASAQPLRDFSPDVVVDLVLSSGRQARELMDIFRGFTQRIVALSSCDVYRACGILHGIEPGPLEPVPLTEDSRLRTKLQTYTPERIRMLQHVFAWLDDEYDKIPVEREVLGDAQLPATVLRLPMVYGPGDPLHRLFPLVKRMDDGRPAILLEQKNAAWRGPRGYVENVAAAVALAATTTRSAVNRVFNVGEPDNASELAWAKQVADVVGWTGEFILAPADRIPAHLRMPGNMDQHWATDTTRIRQELGYTEPVARDEAIRRTVEWERATPPATPLQPLDYKAEDEATFSLQSQSQSQSQ